MVCNLKPAWLGGFISPRATVQIKDRQLKVYFFSNGLFLENLGLFFHQLIRVQKQTQSDAKRGGRHDKHQKYIESAFNSIVCLRL